MSTKNTSQIVIDLTSKYIGIPETRETLNDSSIFELSKSFIDDTQLRTFFIAKRFQDYFKNLENKNHQNVRRQETWFYNFVKTTLLFPAIYRKFIRGEVFYFFNLIKNDVNDIFKNELNREMNDVCAKAEKMGIFESHAFMAQYGNEVHLLSEGSQKPESYYQSAKFYKLSPALIDFWIKDESKLGKMLEVWIYELLKYYICSEDYTVFYNTQVRARSEPSYLTITDLVEGPITNGSQDETYDIPKSDDIAEFDSIIMHKDIVEVAIECKMSANWEDAIKLYGGLKLLNIPSGILISAKLAKAFQTVDEFENIKIFNGVLDKTDFPNH